MRWVFYFQSHLCILTLNLTFTFSPSPLTKIFIHEFPEHYFILISNSVDIITFSSSYLFPFHSGAPRTHLICTELHFHLYLSLTFHLHLSSTIVKMEGPEPFNSSDIKFSLVQKRYTNTGSTSIASMREKLFEDCIFLKKRVIHLTDTQGAPEI